MTSPNILSYRIDLLDSCHLLSPYSIRLIAWLLELYQVWYMVWTTHVKWPDNGIHITGSERYGEIYTICGAGLIWRVGFVTAEASCYNTASIWYRDSLVSEIQAKYHVIWKTLAVTHTYNDVAMVYHKYICVKLWNVLGCSHLIGADNISRSSYTLKAWIDLWNMILVSHYMQLSYIRRMRNENA